MRLTEVYRNTCLLTAAMLVAPLTAAHAATTPVHAGGSLQAALNAAQPGDVILLDPGVTFTGNFTLPVKTGATYITVRSAAADAQLPPPGARITPAAAALLPKIQSPNKASALAAAPGAHHWRLMCLEFLANSTGAGEIIRLGEGSSAQSQLSQVPYEIELDRVYLHGDPVVGQKRGIALNGRAITIHNSYIADIKAVAQDSQAIGGWNGPGPFTIENNFIEAAGENFLLGGSDPSIPNLVSSDVVVRFNHFSKPMAWRSENWQVKNLFELKNARHVTVEYNLMEHNWAAAQTGYAVLLTPRNQGGLCPWCVVEDVTFQHNVVRTSGAGISLSGYDSNNPSQQTNGIRIRDNLFSGITTALGGTGWFMVVGDEPRDVVIDHNTIDGDGNAILFAYGGTAAAPRKILGFRFTNNAARHNLYGLNAANFGYGLAAIAGYFPDGVVAGNWLPGGTAAKYPAGNTFSGTLPDAYPNAAAGDYRPLASTMLLTGSTDGLPIGADTGVLMDLLPRIDGGVSMPSPRPPSAVRITVR